MSIPLANTLFLLFSFLAGLWMILEGCRILLLKQQITPFPTRILHGLCMLIWGKEKTSQRYTSRTSPKDLRSYASYVLFFGPLVILSCLVFLFSAIL